MVDISATLNSLMPIVGLVLVFWVVVSLLKELKGAF